MNGLFEIGGVLVFLAGLLTLFLRYLAKTWKLGPFLDMPSTDESVTEVKITQSTPEASTSPATATSTPQMIPATSSTPQASTGQITPMIDKFCLAIRDKEGGPGDANYRNNNPGNCRCSPVGYLAKYGKVGCSPSGFAIFETYQLGWEYLQALVLHRAQLHPDWTIQDFFNDYAPSADGNDPIAYATFVAKRCGVPVNSTLKVLFS